MLTSHLATRLSSGVDAHFLLSRRKYFLHETAHNKVCGQDFWKETLLLTFSNLFFGTLSTTREVPWGGGLVFCCAVLHNACTG